MAAIYLIRHGQASFGKADYDQLSDKGAQQSQHLGKFWRTLASPNKVFTGDLLRHEQTLENFLIGYQGNKPSTVLHSGFNEFNHVDLLTRSDARWKSFAHMASLISKSPDGNKAFQKEFAQALNRWVEGKHDGDYLESWPMFKKRCIAALYDVINHELAAKKLSSKAEPSKDICIFTSGGTISVLIQHVLDLTDQNTLAVNQQLRNTSVTKLLFSEGKISIDYLNNYAHLADKPADWVTFR
ncbi:MAG: histidine phosphatase family protein [Colwellia polaris]|jgi:broad specificity phosphatase PhoE|uniref:histidine phosphatase family protein n=1 Tax=Colwellia polaris TaxID=326537 RepID=UPI000A16D940|nr:histidine phosphatase family protein [Colwellia polaris]|tara:strand:+ start:329 stop:1051 length:723 start_codon:yes stop_codon:yes gene_type:complete